MLKKTVVMFYLPCLGLGGIERVVQNIVNYLPQKYTIIIFGQIEVPDNLLSRLSMPENVILVPGGRTKRFESDRYIPLFIYDLLKKIKEYKPDIIFSFWHRTNLTTGLALKMIGKKRKPAWVFSIHGESPGYGDENYRQSIKKKMLQYLAHNADAHVTITPKLVKRCNSYYKGLSFFLLYNPAVDDSILFSAKENIKEDFFEGDKTILSIGRLDEMKDYQSLIRAFKKVNQSVEESRLVILGDGPERENLECLISDLDLSEKVFLPGFKSNPYKYIKGCRLFVLSSSVGEASPMVLSEAMFLSKPIVTTNFFTASDIITHNETGLITKVKEPEDLAISVLELLLNDKKAEYFGKQARQIACERYYNKRSVKRYEELIEKIIYEREEKI